jgi:DNA-binding transcriptional ArsR family regulator
MDEIKILKSLEEIKALSDAYRYRILNTFYNFGEPATVKQVADAMKEVPANVYYHVKKLEKVDILRLMYTKDVNGIIAKYYEPTARQFSIEHDEESEEVNNNLVLGETQRVVSELFNSSKEIFIKEIGNKISDKGKDKSGGKMSSGELYLTKEEAEEFSKLVIEFFDKYNSPDKDKLRKKYHCFFGIIDIK